MDKLDAKRRSANMSKIRSKNSKPEVRLRSMLHKAGYRFRLHRKDLPGKPDIVFASRRKVIFIHGCFWHQHGGCREGRLPQTRQDYWIPKFEGNAVRDAQARLALESAGWKVLVVWECQIERQPIVVLSLVIDFLTA